MVVSLKLRKVGNSVGTVLPKEVLARMKAEIGDTLYVTDAPGGVLLTPFEPEFERQMEAARKVMRKHRDALRELAK